MWINKFFWFYLKNPSIEFLYSITKPLSFVKLLNSSEAGPVTINFSKVNKLNRFKKKNNDFIRRFTAGLKFIELDNTGRLLIPKELTEFANIKREIVLSSSVNIIEIWDKSKYEKTIDDSKSDFAQLAEEVMGDDEN